MEICNSGCFFIILIFYILDGFHVRRRPNQEKASERLSCYCHDEGYFKRGCPDLLKEITLTKVNKVWTWILLQTNLLAWTKKKNNCIPSQQEFFSSFLSQFWIPFLLRELMEPSYSIRSENMRTKSRKKYRLCVFMICLIDYYFLNLEVQSSALISTFPSWWEASCRLGM